MNRAFGSREAELAEFDLNALGSPPEILHRHPREQVNRIPRDLGFCTLGLGLGFSEQAKSLAMPVQERTRLEDVEGAFLMLDAAGQVGRQTIRSRKDWLLDLSVEDDEVMAEKCVLSDEFGLASFEVDCRWEDD